MIVQLLGGLGNQMFQWAFGQSLAKKRGVMPPHFYLHPRMKQISSHITYALNAYDIPVPLSSYTHIPGGHATFSEKGPGVFDDRVLSFSPDAFYTGYWQTEKYFFDAEAIRVSLARPKGLPGRINAELAQRILDNPDCAFIHIRRGDYTNPQTRAFHGLMPTEYFDAGANRIRDKFPGTRFFVFSDDIKWCDSIAWNFPIEAFVDNNHWADGTAQWDLWLMSLCNRGGVISNSSFSWWGAWLGDTHADRLVVAPKKWFQADVSDQDIVPERWLKI